MADDRLIHLRHHPARRRAGPRLLDEHGREAAARAAAPGAGGRRDGGGVPHRVEGRRRGGAPHRVRDRRTGHRRPRPLQPRRHRVRGRVREAGAALAHPHVHRDLRPAPRAEAPHLARRVPAVGGRQRQAGPLVHRRRGVLGRGRHAQRHRLPVPGGRDRDRPGGDDHQPARHRGLLHGGRDRAVLHRHHRPRPQRRPGGVQRPLPRRPRARGGELAGRGARRVPPDRVHHQRHRRTGRQRVARGAGDGDAGAARPDAVRDRDRDARDLSPRAASCRS